MYFTTVRGHSYYYQVVLEVRVDSTVKGFKFRETMAVGEHFAIDQRFPGNENIEVGLASGRRDGFVTPSDGVVVTGLMVRYLGVDPGTLKESIWWQAWGPAIGVMDIRSSYYLRI